jgi:hypothetical protein
MNATQKPLLEEFTEERRRLIRNTDDLVRCLAIELKIELGPGLAVIPVGEMLELASPQRPLGQRCPSDGQAHTWCLPGDAAFLRDDFGGSDNAARYEALPALILAREHENRVAFGDMLTPIHRLLCREREPLRLRITNLGFDRERHPSPPPPHVQKLSAVVVWRQPGTLSFVTSAVDIITKCCSGTGAGSALLAEMACPEQAESAMVS